jgi:hypothetical protein
LTDRLFLAWQDQDTRRWHTIGQLTAMGDSYEFVFTKGVKYLRSLPSTLFKMKPGERFRSANLMPLFKNKIPPSGRADFAKIAHWVGLEGGEDEFTLLKRFGLIAGTDSLMVYPEPNVEDGRYTVDFFVHGMRYMHDDVAKWCNSLSERDVLLPLLDVKNPVDPTAVALRGKEGTVIVGYVPTFYANDLYRILRHEDDAQDAKIRVRRINLDAPIQLRLLCRFTAQVGEGFRTLDTDDHQPLLVVAALNR